MSFNSLHFLKSTFLLVIFLMVWASCSRNPVTGKKEVMLMSSKKERALGEQSDPGIVASFGSYQNPGMQKFINEKGQKMAKISHRPGLAYEFKILDSPVINAFAVPGGFVYFTRGIMAHFNNEAEFAGVLGHEIGHITARHSAKQYSKSMIAQVGLIVGIVASKEFRQFAQQAQQGVGLLFLKFGRDNESESDQLGVEYSTKIGYDAHHMANFFQTLHRMRGDGEAIPTFLSTHPDPLDRYNKVHDMATKSQREDSKSKYDVGRDSYLRMIDGLIYGEDPRQGYVENNNFYHPELKFQFPIPSNWRTQNSPTQFQMAPEDGKAMMVLTLAQGASVDEAGRAFVTDNKLTLIESNRDQINNLPALVLVADQPNEQDPNATLRTLNYFIEYNKLIYRITGVSLKTDFNRYASSFERTMRNFDTLTDASKINVKPDKISIKTLPSNMTLSKALDTFKVASDKKEEHAILNSMKLNQSLKKGSLLKVVEYDRVASTSIIKGR